MTAVRSLCVPAVLKAHKPETAADENLITADSGDAYYEEEINNAAAGDAAQ